jgi:hypothetical protein
VAKDEAVATSLTPIWECPPPLGFLQVMKLEAKVMNLNIRRSKCIGGGSVLMATTRSGRI